MEIVQFCLKLQRHSFENLYGTLVVTGFKISVFDVIFDEDHLVVKRQEIKGVCKQDIL